MAQPRLPLSVGFDKNELGLVITDRGSRPILKVINEDMQLARAVCDVINAMPEIENLLIDVMNRMQRVSVGLEDIGHHHTIFRSKDD